MEDSEREEGQIPVASSLFPLVALAALALGVGGAEPAAKNLPTPDIFVVNADGSGPLDLTNYSSWDTCASSR